MLQWLDDAAASGSTALATIGLPTPTTGILAAFALTHGTVEGLRIGRVQQYRLRLLHDEAGELGHLPVDVGVAAGIKNDSGIAELLRFIGHAVKDRRVPWTLDVGHRDADRVGSTHGSSRHGMVTPIDATQRK